MAQSFSQTHIQQLAEHIHDWKTDAIRVDPSQNIVRDVALAGLKSKNGYRYSEEALRQALPLYENKPVFLDHADNTARPYERSTRDLVGSIVNPRFENGRVRGDIQVLETDAGRTFIALAQSANATVGMSHVVLAQRSSDPSVVERIQEVVSVDAVVFPATTSTLREQTHGRPSLPPPGSLEALLAEIDEQLPRRFLNQNFSAFNNIRRAGLFPGQLLIAAEETRDTGDDKPPQTRYFAWDWTFEKGAIRLGTDIRAVPEGQFPNAQRTNTLHRLLAEWRAQTDSEIGARLASLGADLETAAAERDALRARNEALERQHAEWTEQQQIDHLLAESGLPDDFLTESFRQLLQQAPSQTARAALIRERRALLAHRPPISRERAEPGGSDLDDQAIVSLIRGTPRSVLGSSR